ncbi:hypothetical protein AAFF_G00125560 [Aldrovandia affinis]|uniref:Uncharacterized protein n=1 Tax=Aldrovandia affinis TaxID=143900 RepID=A0AAD7WA24_9TELE|nr:hypothetical protein AAFF_G00125560 [Aldrovandia affinis]
MGRTHAVLSEAVCQARSVGRDGTGGGDRTPARVRCGCVISESPSAPVGTEVLSRGTRAEGRSASLGSPHRESDRGQRSAPPGSEWECRAAARRVDRYRTYRHSLARSLHVPPSVVVVHSERRTHPAAACHKRSQRFVYSAEPPLCQGGSRPLSAACQLRRRKQEDDGILWAARASASAAFVSLVSVGVPGPAAALSLPQNAAERAALLKSHDNALRRQKRGTPVARHESLSAPNHCNGPHHHH